MLKRLLGNGRALAAAVLALGLAAIAMPAFGKGGDGTSGQDRRPNLGLPAAALPPPIRLDGRMRERVAKSAKCMRNQDIPGAEKRAHGFTVPRAAASSRAFRAAASKCGAPLPPHGKLLPPPMGTPGGRAKFDLQVRRCLGARRPPG